MADIEDILANVSPLHLTEFTDDEVLKHTQSIRKKFLDSLVERGFPKDPKDQKIFLNTLSDMDKVAMGNKRIGANEKQSAADALVAQALADMTAKLGKTNPFEAGTDNSIPEPVKEKLGEANPVPGEMDIGLSQLDYETFMAETNPEYSKER